MQRPNMKEYIKIYAILIVLSNINEFQENFFFDKNLKKDTILFSFLQEMRILWNNFGDKNEKNFQDYENIYTSFIMQINKLSENKGINNIFDNLKSLFEEILLQIQNDLYELKYKKKFNYQDRLFNIKSELENLYSKKTVLEDLFFFENESSQYRGGKNINNSFFMRYFLEFDINEKEVVKDIKSLFDKLNESINDVNTQPLNIFRKFITLPKYLIIIINNKNKDLRTMLNNNLDIKTFCENKDVKAQFKLISFIDSEKVIPICKSPVNDKWYKYDSIIEEENSISQVRPFPKLLIYKQNIKEK